MIESNLIREGLVASINSNYTCDVYFPDQDYTATGLKISNPGGTRNKDWNLPNINDLALCVFIPPSLTDGWIIGFGYNDEDKPPAGNENVHSTTYMDGTSISYDSKSHKLTIACKGEITINANVMNLNGKVMINAKPWLTHQHSAGNLVDGNSKPVTGKSGDGMVE